MYILQQSHVKRDEKIYVVETFKKNTQRDEPGVPGFCWGYLLIAEAEKVNSVSQRQTGPRKKPAGCRAGWALTDSPTGKQFSKRGPRTWVISPHLGSRTKHRETTPKNTEKMSSIEVTTSHQTDAVVRGTRMLGTVLRQRFRRTCNGTSGPAPNWTPALQTNQLH